MQRLYQHLVSTTLRFPCVAQQCVIVESADEIPALMASLKGHPFRVLGGGSNVLCASAQLPYVIQLAIKGIVLTRCDESAFYLEVGAGESWHELVLHTVAQGWAGLENLALIPGWVGAAPVQNIGAYGVEIEQRIHSVRAWDCDHSRWVSLGHDACQFAYRDSVFKRNLGRYLITHVTFKLLRPWRSVLTYQPLKQRFVDVAPADINPAAVCEAVIAIRQSKLPNPAVLPNAGSFFKNPVITGEQAEALRARFPAMPQYPQVDGRAKLAAGWLIEQCGWKGHRAQTTQGSVGVHQDQALVLVHHGGAVGADLLSLAQAIQTSVEHTFGVALEREVNVW